VTASTRSIAGLSRAVAGAQMPSATDALCSGRLEFTARRLDVIPTYLKLSNSEQISELALVYCAPHQHQREEM
jgi:hypothetical protein